MKQLELLVEAFPERTRVAVLWDSGRQISSVRSSVQCNRCDCRCARSSSKIHRTISTQRFERWCRGSGNAASPVEPFVHAAGRAYR